MKDFQKFYEQLARALQWVDDTNEAFQNVADDLVSRLIKQFPSGSGIDAPIEDVQYSKEKDIITAKIPYHHMDENGYYSHWGNYYLKVFASLFYGVIVEVKPGETGNMDTAEYLAEVFEHVEPLDNFILDVNNKTKKA